MFQSVQIIHFSNLRPNPRENKSINYLSYILMDPCCKPDSLLLSPHILLNKLHDELGIPNTYMIQNKLRIPSTYMIQNTKKMYDSGRTKNTQAYKFMILDETKLPKQIQAGRDFRVRKHTLLQKPRVSPDFLEDLKSSPPPFVL